MKVTGSRPRIVVSADGRGVAGHVGTRLLADVAEVTGLSGQLRDALAPLRQRRRGHGPGRVALDLAVMLADGGEANADLAVLRDQPDVFGKVASDATGWRVLSTMDSRTCCFVQRLGTEPRVDELELADAKPAWAATP